MYACMRVCVVCMSTMFACVRCMCVCVVGVCIGVCMYACVHVRMHVCLHMFMCCMPCMCRSVVLHGVAGCVFLHRCPHVMRACVCMRARMHV